MLGPVVAASWYSSASAGRLDAMVDTLQQVLVSSGNWGTPSPGTSDSSGGGMPGGDGAPPADATQFASIGQLQQIQQTVDAQGRAALAMQSDVGGIRDAVTQAQDALAGLQVCFRIGWPCICR